MSRPIEAEASRGLYAQVVQKLVDVKEEVAEVWKEMQGDRTLQYWSSIRPHLRNVLYLVLFVFCIVWF
jgi:hypothetical protein